MREAHNRQSLVPGSRYGKLTVASDCAPGLEAKLVCDCGNTCSKNRTAVRRGLIKSCGCLQICHATELGRAQAKAPGYSECIIHFGAYKRRALKRGLPFELSFEEFFETVQQPCFYCGTPPDKGTFFKHHGIDRYDSSKGYTAENAVTCCEFCNRAKSDVPPQVFESWMERISGDKPYRPQGWVAISKIVDGFGKEVPYDKAVKYGWISRSGFDNRALFGAEADYEQATPNLFLDQGRQLLAFAFAFRSPIEDYACRKFAVGTGLTAAKVSDVALEAPITLNSGQVTGSIDSIDFLAAFVIRVSFTLGLADANGYTITEMGLYSGNNTLLARKIRAVAVNKTSDFSPTLTWRLRF